VCCNQLIALLLHYLSVANLILTEAILLFFSFITKTAKYNAEAYAYDSDSSGHHRRSQPASGGKYV
jgi:hypothetical protein